MTGERSAQETYERVMGVIKYNTGDPQPCGIRWSTLLTIACSHGQEDPEDVRTAIQAANHNDDILVWTDREGHERFTRADNEDLLLEVVERQTAREDPDHDVVAEANELLGVVDA